MSNELFTDLTAEQQEVVAGGLDLSVFDVFNETKFAEKNKAFDKDIKFGIISKSGPEGSTAGFDLDFSVEELIQEVLTTGATKIS